MTYRGFKLAMLSLLLIASSANAWQLTDSFIETYAALREDSLKWKVKGKRRHHVIVEEECFVSQKMFQKGIYSEVTFCDRIALKADGSYSFAYNRPNGWAFDLSVGVGYRFNLCCNAFQVTPYVGYEINREHFHSCGNRSLNNDCSGCGTFSKLTSSYRAHWNSPWIGIDWRYAINECWKAYSNFAYQFVTLRGKGRTGFGDRHVNGCQEQDRFHQHSNDAWGISFGGGIQYAIDCNWLLDLGAQFEYRKADHGHQKSHGAIGSSSSGGSDDCGVCGDNGSSGSGSSSSNGERKHRLKRVEWRSLRVGIGLAYRF